MKRTRRPPVNVEALSPETFRVKVPRACVDVLFLMGELEISIPRDVLERVVDQGAELLERTRLEHEANVRERLRAIARGVPVRRPRR